MEAIEFASQIGLKAALFTNGLRLTEEYIDRLMAQPNFMLLWISTKADNSKAYAQVTGVSPNAYERLLRHIEAVGKARLKRPADIVLKGTNFISKWTYNSFAEKAAFLKANHFNVYKGELHVPTFYEALRDHPREIRRNVEKLKQLESADFITSHHEIPTIFNPGYKRYKTPPRKCFITDSRLYIDGKGNCYPCLDWIDNSTQRGYSLGNIKKQSIREIWEGEKRRELAMMDGSDTGQHPFCKFCATPQANEVFEQMINALTEYPHAQFRKVFRPGYEPGGKIGFSPFVSAL
ncbi:SPASM domain-containing protein [Candidatus Daviesbacteria bacterium]|nr:SPASM domain-containing protein [Candidatus Daviesbacteria bacterium]